MKLIRFLNNPCLSAFALIFVLVLVCLPRFDRNEFMLEGVVGAGAANDSAQYIAMVEIYRAQKPEVEPSAPFTYRALVPYLASLIPAPAMTAINIINLLAMGVGVLFMRQTVISGGAPIWLANLLLLIYIVSFPVFYYGTIGYLDPVVIGAFGVGCYLIREQRNFYFGVLFIAGVFVKETIVILLPVYFIYALLDRRSLLYSALTLVFCCVGYYFATLISRYISIDQISYVWSPSLDRFEYNISRSRTWLSMILSIGLPGALAMSGVGLVIYKRDWALLTSILPWLTGIAGSFALFAYSLASAYSDGRFIWPATVFAIPLLGQILVTYSFLPSALKEVSD